MSGRQVQDFYLEEIEVHDRVRAVNLAAVNELAASMRAVGLQTPISCRLIDDEVEGQSLVLVAGLHRLEAAKELGWDKIAVHIVTMDEAQARLWEIAENLHRAELTVQERAEHIAEWIRLTDKVAQVGPVSGGRGNEGGIRAASRELGIDRKEADRANKIAGLAEEAKQAARQTGLDDNQAALLAAAAAPKEKQATVIREIAERGRVKPSPAPLHEFESEENWRRSMLNLWNRAPQDWRERFIETVDSPVFDQTRAA